MPPIGSSSRSRPGEPDDLDVRVAGEQPDQLGADVAGRADDPDPDPARPTVVGDAPARTRRSPDERSVSTAAGDSSPALTGAWRRSRAAGSGDSPGSEGPSSWAYDYTGPA